MTIQNLAVRAFALARMSAGVAIIVVCVSASEALVSVCAADAASVEAPPGRAYSGPVQPGRFATGITRDQRQPHVGVGNSADGLLRVGASQPTLTSYPNVVFAARKPGFVGLYVMGEQWHVLVNLPGFEHVDAMPFTGPSQFLFMAKQVGTGDSATQTTASVFADRLDGVGDTQACQKHHAPSIERARVGISEMLGKRAEVSAVSEGGMKGKHMLSFEVVSKDQSFSLLGPLGRRKSFHWFAYHAGYCFHYHFDMTGGEDAEEAVQKAIDSVAVDPQKPTGVIVDKLFYLDRLRIRLPVPIEWRHSYHPSPPGPVGGIEFKPAGRENFSFVVFPLGVPRQPEGTFDLGKAEAEKMRAWHAQKGLQVSTLRERCASETCFYFVDVGLRPDGKPDERGFSMFRQGIRKVGGMFFGLSAFYADASADAVDTIATALSRATVLDLAARQTRLSNKIESGGE